MSSLSRTEHAVPGLVDLVTSSSKPGVFLIPLGDEGLGGQELGLLGSVK